MMANRYLAPTHDPKAAMNRDAPNKWNDEKWVTGELVRAIDAGDSDAKSKFGQRLLDGVLGDGWQSCFPLEDGFFLPFAAFDSTNLLGEDLDVLCERGVVTAERDYEICEGAPLEGSELAYWREMVLERGLAPECATFWVIFEVKCHGSRRVYVAAIMKEDPTTGSLSDLSFAAAYLTYSEALNGLRKIGFVGRKDFQARSAEVFTRM